MKIGSTYKHAAVLTINQYRIPHVTYIIARNAEAARSSLRDGEMIVVDHPVLRLRPLKEKLSRANSWFSRREAPGERPGSAAA